jgi:hypothetical protein
VEQPPRRGSTAVRCGEGRGAPGGENGNGEDGGVIVLVAIGCEFQSMWSESCSKCLHRGLDRGTENTTAVLNTLFVTLIWTELPDHYSSVPSLKLPSPRRREPAHHLVTLPALLTGAAPPT